MKVLRQVIQEQVGEDALDLAIMLKKQKDISEFSLSEQLKEDINTIRNKLYRLQQKNLIGFRKKKDDVKGWYVYFWHLKPEAIIYAHDEVLKSKMAKIDSQLADHSLTKYTCKNECIIFNEEDALHNNYTCPDCGALLKIDDRSKIIERLTKKKEKLKSSMDTLGVPRPKSH